MKKGKPTKERVHRVKCAMNVVELPKAGASMKLTIYADGEVIGTIDIGRGSFTWRGSKRQNAYKWSWTEFAKLMNENYPK